MKKIIIAVFFLFVLSGGDLVFAEGDIVLAKTIKCNFGKGTTIRFFDQSQVLLKTPKFDQNDWGDEDDIIFDAINFENQTARIIGNNGSSDVVCVKGSGITFVEITSAGAVQVFAIYNKLNNLGEYIAVQSRHTAIASYPIPAQYVGSCKIVE